MKVSLFVTCIIDQLYPSVGVSTVELLRRLGCDVTFPSQQICCGQPAFNSGYVDAARQVALNNIKALHGSEYVVCPSGSCTGMMKHHYRELFKEDPKHLAMADDVVNRTYELSQFVVNVLKVTDVGARFPHSVTYHPSCHGSRILGALHEPLSLLRNVADINLIPLEKSQDCCGFGGAFAVKMSAISGAMVAEKVDRIEDTHAKYLVGSDMACLMNISGSMKRRGLTMQVLHLSQLLNEGIDAPQRSRNDLLA